MALQRFKCEPTEGNLNAYRIARAKARRGIRHSKKTYWRNYVSKMNSQTSVKFVWNRIRKIKGKDTSNTVHHLSVNDRNVMSHRDIANALADNFSNNSSSAFSTDTFASVRKKAERQTIKFSSDNPELYNRPFPMEELQNALCRDPWYFSRTRWNTLSAIEAFRVGSTFSDSRPQEMGVPQGSILSVTLFSLKLNSITRCLKPGVDCSLYVDDFQVCYRSSNMSITERQLQLFLNKLQQWATDNGFQFSKTKTVCMYICQKRGLHLDQSFFWTKVQFQ